MSLDVWLEEKKPVSVFDYNITHNLASMALEAGVYQHLWRPEEIGVTKARQLIKPLTKAIAALKKDPDRFRAFDAPNGWGTYEHLLDFCEAYKAACQANPKATIGVSR